MTSTSTSTRTIYTMGYTGRSVQSLIQTAIEHNAYIVDIRLSPQSRVPQWRKSALQAVLGEIDPQVHRYQWAGAYLGNVNYKGGPIRLVQPQGSIIPIQTLLQKHNIILLCVCKNWRTCHRRQAAEYVQAHIPGITITHL